MKTRFQPDQHPAVRRSVIAVLCAVVLIAACSPAIEGTLALLTTKTQEMVNVFTLGELGYELSFDANKPSAVADDETVIVTGMPENPYAASVEAGEHVFEVTEEPTLAGYQFAGWGKTADTTAESTDGFYAFAAAPAAGEESGEDAEAVKKSLVPVEYNEDGRYKDGKTSKTVYAVWQPMSFTLSFDVQAAGVTVPEARLFSYLMPYGELPVLTRTDHDFLGWSLDQNGVNKVTEDTIANIDDSHALYAQWRYTASTGNSKVLSITESEAKNAYGLSEEIKVELVGGSYFDKLYFKLENLVPNQKYRLSFTESHNATCGNYEGAFYGSSVNSSPQMDSQNNNDLELAKRQDGVIAEYENRNELTSTNDVSMTFTATDETMYWIWNFGLMQDSQKNEFVFQNIKLEKIAPAIAFGEPVLKTKEDSTASISVETSNDHGVQLKFKGAASYEAVYFPITGLAAGSEYTIKFTHSFDGNYGNTADYDYGCVITDELPPEVYSYLRFNDNFIKAHYSCDPIILDNLPDKAEYEFTFTATGSTHYWYWLMSSVQDGVESTIDIQLTELSTSYNGGEKHFYYAAPASLSTEGVMVTVDFGEGVTVNGTENAAAGVPCVLTLSGDQLPEILIIQTSEAKYVTGSAAETLLQAYASAQDAELRSEWLVSGSEAGTQILTLPAELMTESASIAITGANLATTPLDDMTYNDLN